jgi:hypothetical protein
MVEESLLSSLRTYSFVTTLREKMLHPWKQAHGDLVKRADILSAYHEARIEAPNSQEYQDVTKRLEERLREL